VVSVTRREVPDSWPCVCGHRLSSHLPGVACRRCGCDRFSPEADDRAEGMEREGNDGLGERMYERWIGSL
jgi:hypothetical protein